MAKVKITTRTCPLCGYIYERKQTYEMVKKEKETFSFNNGLKHTVNALTIPVEECTKDEVTKGNQEFKELRMPKYDETDDFSNITIGMFCPKCGIFLNHKTCTTYKETEV